MFVKLWKDEAGFLVSMELIFVATILILGLVVGWTALESSVTSEWHELANAVTSLSQAYAISGQIGCAGFTQGSAATDTAQSLGFSLIAASANNINVIVCNGAVTP